MTFLEKRVEKELRSESGGTSEEGSQSRLSG